MSKIFHPTSASKVGADLRAARQDIRRHAARPEVGPYLVLLALALAPLASAKDWPMWGGSPARNMVAEAKGIPDDINAGKFLPKSETIDMKTTKNIRWVSKLGSQAYGSPVVAGGRVFVGTNNEAPRDPKQTGDRAVLMCFDEKTGEFLWQLVIPKVGAG